MATADPPAPVPDPPLPDTDPERRRWVRYSCGRGLKARAHIGDQGVRPARVLELSRGGLCLLLPGWFPEGTALRVLVGGWKKGRPLVARATRSQERPEGWVHGCRLAEPLHVTELLDLLDLIALQEEAASRLGP